MIAPRIPLAVVVAVLASSCAASAVTTHYTSPQGGHWHDAATWRSGTVPPRDLDRSSVRVLSPLTLSTGVVTTASCYIYPSGKDVSLVVGPMAHFNVTGSLWTQRALGQPIAITVRGSMMLHVGGSLYGATRFSVPGGHLYAMGRKLNLCETSGAAPTLSVSQGGMAYIRRLHTQTGSTIRIDEGECQIEELYCMGPTRIHVTHGAVLLNELEMPQNATFILGRGGELLLQGDLTAETLPRAFPDIRILSEDLEPAAIGELVFRAGTGRFRQFTRVSIPASVTADSGTAHGN